MCASALALHDRCQTPLTPLTRIVGRRAATIAIPGVAVGLFAVLAFGTIHAWLIVPIWSRLAGGLPFAVLAGVSLAWAFDRAAHVRRWHTPVHGLLFGVYMFGTLLPATALDAAMRLNGLRLGDTTTSTIIAVALYVTAGFLAGWVVSRQRSTAIVFAAATLTLMAVSGGPLPIGRSPRGAWLSLGVACIAALAGAGIATVRSIVGQRL